MKTILLLITCTILANTQLSDSILTFITLLLKRPNASEDHRLSPATAEIFETSVKPVTVQTERNSYMYQEGAHTKRKAMDCKWCQCTLARTDENVIHPAGRPFHPPFKASYPTFGRITKVIDALQTVGARTI